MSIIDLLLGQEKPPAETKPPKLEKIKEGDLLGSAPQLSKRERDRLEFIDSLNESGNSREIKSVMYAGAQYESGGSFDTTTVERLEKGATRPPTRESYLGYLGDNEYENTPTNESRYYTEAFKDPYGTVGSYLGSGYMLDYAAFNEGKPSQFRVHHGSGIKKVYEPTLEGINEHFTNFMMNPREDARKDSMQKRLKMAKEAYENIFTD